MYKFLTIAALTAFSVQASASDKSDIMGLPHCVKPCTEYAAIAASCDRSDPSCLCQDTSFEYSVHKCLFSQCQPHEYLSAFNYLKVLCPEGMSDRAMINEKPLLKKLHARQASGSASASASASGSGAASGSGSASGSPTASSSGGISTPSGSLSPSPTSGASKAIVSSISPLAVAIAGVLGIAAHSLISTL